MGECRVGEVAKVGYYRYIYIHYVYCIRIYVIYMGWCIIDVFIFVPYWIWTERTSNIPPSKVDFKKVNLLKSHPKWTTTVHLPKRTQAPAKALQVTASVFKDMFGGSSWLVNLYKGWYYSPKSLYNLYRDEIGHYEKSCKPTWRTRSGCPSSFLRFSH